VSEQKPYLTPDEIVRLADKLSEQKPLVERLRLATVRMWLKTVNSELEARHNAAVHGAPDTPKDGGTT
jgi:hypothetical protein